MKRRSIPVTAAILFAAVGGSISAAGSVAALPVGEAEIIFSLPAGNHPEGIAFDRSGNIYLGNRREGTDVTFEILRISPDSDVSTFAVLGTEAGADPTGAGLLGLTTDPPGNVYAALVSSDPALHGVWRISADGSERSRLPGSQQMDFPNALTFDPRGNLYVTDSFEGAIWRFPGSESGSLWTEHELLEPFPFDPAGIPLPGANGIAFSPPNHLYVANTEKGLIAQVPINLQDGSAGEPTLVAQAFELLTVDGLAVDVTGQIHGVIPAFAVLGISPLVRVDPATGDTVATVDSSAFGEFDFPLSLAFGRGARDHQSVYVANGDLPFLPGGPGPGITQANVGVSGFPVS
jgi:DNA-binding beta-propeller fold protein YncE